MKKLVLIALTMISLNSFAEVCRSNCVDGGSGFGQHCETRCTDY